MKHTTRKILTALTASGCIILPLAFTVFLAAYSQHEFRTRFASGPWSEAIVEDVFVVSRSKSGQILGYDAHVKFENVVAGAVRVCKAAVNIGMHGDSFHGGDVLRIAPRHGSCAEAATAYD